MTKVRVFIAMSLDGYIAGPGDDLSWLPAPDFSGGGGEGGDKKEGGEEDSFTKFMRDVGAILMGRNTYRIPAEHDGPWPYGDTPVLVATRQALEKPRTDTVRPVQGTIEELIAEARKAAGAKDVYLDGGQMIRQGLDAGLVDQLDISIAPTVLGEGVPLFAGLKQRCELDLVSQRKGPSGMVEVTYVVKRPGK
eukprot:Hpha_TRINITY_DN15142_c4_g4::TRINITY_DN15142_c4_g4_i1::g.129875::m.129875